MKTGLLVAGIVALLLLLGVAVYFFFFRNPSSGVVVEPGTTFGTSGDYVPSQEPNDFDSSPESPAQELVPRLIRISQGPVAEGVALTSVPVDVVVTTAEGQDVIPGGGSSSVVRYIERTSGNIYEFGVENRLVTRITNQTIPGIVGASWVSDASRAFVRYLAPNGQVVETYSLGETESEGYFLEQNLSQATVGRDDTLVTLLPSTTGSVATLANADGTNVRTLFSSELSSLRVLPAGEDYVAYTKASAGSEGYVFLVDSSTGAFTRLRGPLRGLTALPSNDGEIVLVSYRSGNAIRVELLDVATRTTTSLPISTVSEKCVWATDDSRIFCAVPKTLSGTIPDAWYQGAVSFSDRLWSIDVEARLATRLFDPEVAADVAIDAVALAVDGNSDVLVFSNKNDGSLWMYDL